MLDLTQLQAEVTEQQTVTASAVTLLTSLFTEVEANKNDPAALQALVDAGRQQNAALAAAVQANTPADVPPAG